MGFFDARFGGYLVVAALLIVTPGPDTALVTRHALLAGRRAASFTTFGIGVGSVLWALASVLGIAVLLERSVVVFSVWKLIGAAYLGYLGLRSLIGIFKSSTKQAAALTPPSQTTHLGKWVAFRQGLLNNLLNPKAGAIFATVLPAFIGPGDSPLRLELMIAYEAILLGWLNLYGCVVSRAGQSRFGTRLSTLIQGVTGVVLIALGVRLVYEQK